MDFFSCFYFVRELRVTILSGEGSFPIEVESISFFMPYIYKIGVLSVPISMQASSCLIHFFISILV